MARHQFPVRSSRLVYTGNVFALRSDEVVMPAGGIAVREVIEHPGAVAIVALDGQDRLAMIDQYRHPSGRSLWELPAGLLDVVGEPPLDTATRELAEEVGLAATQWSVLVDLIAAPGLSDESVRIYLATGLSEVERPDLGDDEEADLVLRWWPLADAVDAVLTGDIVNNAAVAGVLAVRAVRTGGGSPRPTDAPWQTRPTALWARRAGQP